MQRVPYSAAMHRLDRVLNALANGNIEAITGTDADTCSIQLTGGTLAVRFRSETQDIVIKIKGYERFVRKNKAARKLLHFIMSHLRPGECKVEFYLSELIDVGVVSYDIRSARRLIKQTMELLEQILIWEVKNRPQGSAKMIKLWSIKNNTVSVAFNDYVIGMLWRADIWLRDDTWWLKDDGFALLLYIEYMRERSRRGKKKNGFAISIKAICKYMAIPSNGKKPTDSCKRVIMNTIKGVEATKFAKLTFEDIREFDRWYKNGKITIGEKVK